MARPKHAVQPKERIARRRHHGPKATETLERSHHPLLDSAATGLDALAYDRLFDPMGMTDSSFRMRFTRDSKGLFIVGLETSARDLGRFGRMLREHGKWKREPLVSSSYLDQATSTSQALNESYGFLFWLNGRCGGLLPPSAPFTGPLIPSAPADVFAALGKDDQKANVARSIDVVLVRLGDAGGESRNALSSFDEELWSRVMAARIPAK